MKSPLDFRRAAVASLVACTATLSSRAWAQAGPEAPPTGGDQGSSGGAGAPPPQQPPQTPSGPRSMLGYGNPQSANGTIGGGNATESSSHPITGEEEDSFDIGAGAGGAGSAHGGATGPVFMGRPTRGISAVNGEVPYSHVVERGDTLWGLCDEYFQNPYQWPRIWSYNPQIRNPHWIYPGDEVHLREGGVSVASSQNEAAGSGSKTLGSPGAGSLVDNRRQVPSGTVFLRDVGWIHDRTDQVWGAVSGSDEEKMFLSDTDQVYLSVGPDHDVRLGQELTVFRPRTTAAAGQIVQILGTVRVNQWDEHNRMARAEVVETLGTIERGSLFGPIERRFQVVPPRRNDADVQAHVLASVHPEVFFGQDQVVFIDKGSAAGLKPGNRLFVVRRGDAWRRSLVTPGADMRVSADDERPMPPLERVPGGQRDQDKYPDEVTAELRVLAVKKDTAVCLVSQSKLEIELKDLVVARKGY